jgi:mannose-6-phosphate isomerase-like protein (cupin superfamily)
MNSRKQFLEKSGLGFLSVLLFPLPVFSNDTPGFEGLVVNEQEGETLMLRNGTTVLRIKIAKTHGSNTMCFLSESILPGEAIPVHKHLNEDELIFIHKGSGIFTLGEKQYAVSEGAVAIVPKGVWHGLQNTGSENIEMRFAYTPSGFEGFFREVGTPAGQPFVKRTKEEKRAIAIKWGMIHKE